jgi:hypothetical protein
MANAVKSARTVRESGRKAATARNAGSAIYLYGVSEAEGVVPERLAGVDGLAPVEALSSGEGLVCWISRVDRAEYGDLLAQNMENLDWLAAASVRHQRVVGTLAQQRDILPARFGTVFLSETSLEADVRARKKMIAAVLARIAGADEWGVKVFVEAQRPSPAARVRSGRDYLKQKAVMLQQRTRVAPPVELEALMESLRRVVLDSVITKKSAAALPGLVWQASFLVRRGNTRRFHGVLEQFARKMTQARIETTGPWPAYSFVNPKAEEGGGKQAAEKGRRKPSQRSAKRR